MKNLTRIFKLNALFLLFPAFIWAQSDLQFSGNPVDFKGHRTTVRDIVYSKDGKELFSCGGNNQVIVFDAENASILRSTEARENKAITNLSLNFDGTLLAYAGFNVNDIIICDAKTLETITIIKDFGMLEDIQFSPTENILTIAGTLVGTKKQIVASYDTETGKLKKKYFTQANDETYPYGLCFSPDGKYLASGICNFNQGIMIWNVETGELYRHIKYNDDIYGIKFSPDGKFIAGGGSADVVLWEVETGNKVRTFSGFTSFVMSIDFDKDGNTIAACGHDYSCFFKTWNVKTGELIQTIGKSSNIKNALAFSPDSQSLAIAFTTSGDLFEVTTIAVYKTEKAAAETKWYQVNSTKAKLILEFPEKPEEDFSSDKNYENYDFILKKPGVVYSVRANKFLFKVDDKRRQSSLQKRVESLKSKLTDVKTTDFYISGNKGVEIIGRDTKFRRHYKVIFVDDVLYQITYSSFDLNESVEEKRFMNSFNVK